MTTVVTQLVPMRVASLNTVPKPQTLNIGKPCKTQQPAGHEGVLVRGESICRFSAAELHLGNSNPYRPL